MCFYVHRVSWCLPAIEFGTYTSYCLLCVTCHILCLQCFDAVGWAAGRASGLWKICGDGGGGDWLVRMEWHLAGWSVCLPLLIFPCTIKSRSSLLAPAHPGGPGKRAVKRLWCGGCGGCHIFLWGNRYIRGDSAVEESLRDISRH